MYQTHTHFLFYTVCPISSDPFYIVSYYMKWVTTSWTYSHSERKSNSSVLRALASERIIVFPLGIANGGRPRQIMTVETVKPVLSTAKPKNISLFPLILIALMFDI